ncbi:Crp/Fnr family transcriptional regulator [Streptomyces sp. NPDC054786]
MSTAYCSRPPADLLSRLRDILVDGPLLGTRLALKRNEYAYSAGDTDQSIYFLESGRLKTVMFSRSGKECLLHICSPGEIFGEQGAWGEVREDSTIAMQDSVLHRVPLSQFISTITQEGLIGDYVAYLSSRLSEQQQAITNLVTVDSEQRLGTILLDLADRLGRGDQLNPRIEDRITHEELARMVGTTRSRIGFFLKAFRSNELIEISQTSRLIVNRQRLSEYLDERYG